MADDCEMCDGTGELDAPRIDEYGNVPCPNCVSMEARERDAKKDARVAELRELLRDVYDVTYSGEYISAGLMDRIREAMARG